MATSAEGEATTQSSKYLRPTWVWYNKPINVILNSDYSKHLTEDLHCKKYNKDNAIPKCEMKSDILTSTNGNGAWVIQSNGFIKKNGIKFIQCCMSVPKKNKLTFTKFHECIFQVTVHEHKRVLEQKEENDDMPSPCSYPETQLEGVETDVGKTNLKEDKKNQDVYHYRFKLMCPPDGEYILCEFKWLEDDLNKSFVNVNYTINRMKQNEYFEKNKLDKIKTKLKYMTTYGNNKNKGLIKDDNIWIEEYIINADITKQVEIYKFSGSKNKVRLFTQLKIIIPLHTLQKNPNVDILSAQKAKGLVIENDKLIWNVNGLSTKDPLQSVKVQLRLLNKSEVKFDSLNLSDNINDVQWYINLKNFTNCFGWIEFFHGVQNSEQHGMFGVSKCGMGKVGRCIASDGIYSKLFDKFGRNQTTKPNNFTDDEKKSHYQNNETVDVNSCIKRLQTMKNSKIILNKRNHIEQMIGNINCMDNDKVSIMKINGFFLNIKETLSYGIVTIKNSSHNKSNELTVLQVQLLLHGQETLDIISFDPSVVMAEYKIKNNKNIIIYSLYCILKLLPTNREAELLKYKLSEHATKVQRNLINVSIQRATQDTNAEYELRIQTNFESNLYADYINIRFPFANYSSSGKLIASKLKSSKNQKGKIHLDLHRSDICWSMKQIRGNQEIKKRICFVSPNKEIVTDTMLFVKKIRMDYNVDGYSASGITVNNVILQILGQHTSQNEYAANWVKYTSCSKQYEKTRYKYLYISHVFDTRNFNIGDKKQNDYQITDIQPTTVDKCMEHLQTMKNSVIVLDKRNDLKPIIKEEHKAQAPSYNNNNKILFIDSKVLKMNGIFVNMSENKSHGTVIIENRLSFPNTINEINILKIEILVHGKEMLDIAWFDKSVFMAEYKRKNSKNVIIYSLYCMLQMLSVDDKTALFQYKLPHKAKEVHDNLLNVSISRSTDDKNNSGEYVLKIITNFDSYLCADYIDVEIPFKNYHSHVAKITSSKIQKGKMNLDLDKNAICWSTKRIRGNAEITRKFYCMSQNKEILNNMIFDMDNIVTRYDISGFSASKIALNSVTLQTLNNSTCEINDVDNWIKYNTYKS